MQMNIIEREREVKWVEMYVVERGEVGGDMYVVER